MDNLYNLLLSSRLYLTPMNPDIDLTGRTEMTSSGEGRGLGDILPDICGGWVGKTTLIDDADREGVERGRGVGCLVNNK